MVDYNKDKNIKNKKLGLNLSFFILTLILRTLQIGLASLITFANFTPTIAVGPIPENGIVESQSVVVRELTIPEYIELESKKSGLDATLATAIAFCESTNRQFDETTGEPLRGIKNSKDVGLFQINERFHKEKSQSLGFDIYTTEGNVGYALWLLENDGSRHWKASKPCWSSKIANNA